MIDSVKIWHMFGFCPLASGSKGNCLYLGSQKTRVLIDIGISAKKAEEKLVETGVDPKSIQAILVTHEHSDHIRGVLLFAAKYNIPVLANAETAKSIASMADRKVRFKIFTTGEPFDFGDISFYPFTVPHDTLDPVAFIAKIEKIKLGICADIGHITSLAIRVLEGCDYLYLEANHEPSMVYASNRPESLKQRILGKQGHLSNQECAALLSRLYHKDLKHVYLAHLSSECNAKEVALRVVREYLESNSQSLPLSIAHQEEISQSIVFG